MNIWIYVQTTSILLHVFSLFNAKLNINDLNSSLAYYKLYLWSLWMTQQEHRNIQYSENYLFNITCECNSCMRNFHDHFTFSAFIKMDSFMFVYYCSTGIGNLCAFWYKNWLSEGYIRQELKWQLHVFIFN